MAANICIVQMVTRRLREKYLPKITQLVRDRTRFQAVWGDLRA